MTEAEARLAAEQELLDHFHDEYDRQIDALRRSRGATADGEAAAELRRMQRAAENRDSGALGPLCFGRFDLKSGETYGIGREAVWGASREVLVINWRQEFANQFYDATPVDPGQLTAKRHYDLEEDDDSILLAVRDDLRGTDVETTADFDKAPIADSLLEALARERTGQMADMVATIQAQQNELIRADRNQSLYIQGGPGTGKTAVALHRLSWWLYATMDGTGSPRIPSAMVVGPNDSYIAFVSGLLPGLGDSYVQHRSLSDLLMSLLSDRDKKALRTRVQQDLSSRNPLKTDIRMQEVIGAAIDDSINVPDGALQFNFRGVACSVPANRLVRQYRSMRGGGVAVREIRRELFTAAGRGSSWLEDELWKQYSTTVGQRGLGNVPTDVRDEFSRGVREDDTLRRHVAEFLPRVEPASLIRALFTDRARLESAAEGLLNAEEIDSLLHETDFEWQDDDLPLVAEAATSLRGMPTEVDHLVIDEAQDLTPIQADLLARHCRRGVMTVVGDLAQATEPLAPRNWSELAAVLTPGREVRQETLEICYRVPKEILDLAAELVPATETEVDAPTAVRLGQRPKVRPAKKIEDAMRRALADVFKEQQHATALTAVICDPVHVDLAKETAEGLDLRTAVLPASVDGVEVVIVPTHLAKGLEFDNVVVVEPRRIVNQSAVGYRMLYIAMTRATQTLSVAHARPLPPPWGPVDELPDVNETVDLTELLKSGELEELLAGAGSVSAGSVATAEVVDLRERVETLEKLLREVVELVQSEV